MFTISAAVRPARLFMRMSSGASKRNENPRSASSKWCDDTPRSASESVYMLHTVIAHPVLQIAEVAAHEREAVAGVGYVALRVGVLVETVAGVRRR